MLISIFVPSLTVAAHLLVTRAAQALPSDVEVARQAVEADSFLFLGASALWRPSSQFTTCADLGLHVGAVEGFSLSLCFSH